MPAPQIAHMVFFKLKDQTPAARDKLVAALDKLAAAVDGVAYYSAGTLTAENHEPAVAVRDFDVALHLVFKDPAAHKAYLPHPAHVKFVEEHKASFAGVRVFDSEVRPKAK
jgi:hypothetical protein